MKRKLRFLAGACLDYPPPPCSLAVARTMTF